MPAKKSWSKAQTENLISSWKDQTNLWDIKSPNYKNKAKRHESLTNFSRKFKCSVSEIQKKLRNLRTRYHREWRRLNNKKSKYNESAWELFNALHFLHKNTEEPSTSNLDEYPIPNFSNEDASPEPKKSKKEDTEEQNIFQKVLDKLGIDDDKFKIFGNFVASEVRSLNFEENRNKLKRTIQRAIVNASEDDDRTEQENMENWLLNQ